MTSDGAENHDEEVFGGGLIYPDAVSGNLSLLTCPLLQIMMYMRGFQRQLPV